MQERTKNFFVNTFPGSAWHRLSPATRQIVLFVIGIKATVLVFGLGMYLRLADKGLSKTYRILGIWNRWDAEAYTSLALHGYTATGDRHFYIVFFPFYPLLVSPIAYLTGDAVLGGILVSGIASIILAILFYELVKLDHTRKTAMSAVWFLFIFPTSFFLHIPYTESVFLALVVGSFYCVRMQSWMLAGILGFLACATRVNGLILCLALPFEIWLIWRQTKKFDPKWLWLGIIPLGFAGYLILNYSVLGDCFAFLHIQREHWQKYLTFPWTSIRAKGASVYDGTETRARIDGLYELVFIAIGFVGTIAAWRYLRPSYGVWMMASWLLFVSTSFILSVPRYTLTMFPLFILTALFAKNRIRFALVSILSILWLGGFIVSFVEGHWTF